MLEDKPLKILLVDDEKKFLDSLSQRIQIKGFEPLTAQSGEEALEIAKKEDVFAAVVDLKMTGMDGVETISRLKQLHPDIKTVLLTGFGDEKTREAAEALDSEYFEKDQMGGFWNFIKTLTQKPIHVLLVDDEEKFLDSVAERIRLKGFEPLLAHNGEEAVRLAKSQPVYAAVVDQKMPGMDGTETIRQLQQIHPDIKTVLLTGFGNEKLKEAAEALDAEYFEKDQMGGFWNFMRRLYNDVENSMAAAGMAAGGDLEDAEAWMQKKKKKGKKQ